MSTLVSGIADICGKDYYFIVQAAASCMDIRIYRVNIHASLFPSACSPKLYFISAIQVMRDINGNLGISAKQQILIPLSLE